LFKKIERTFAPFATLSGVVDMAVVLTVTGVAMVETGSVATVVDWTGKVCAVGIGSNSDSLCEANV